MSRVLIIGATGFIGEEVRRLFLAESEHELTLFSRHTDRLGDVNSERERIVAGSILDETALRQALKGQEIVIWTAGGNIADLTKPVVEEMQRQGIDRLIHMNAMGIYNEVPASVGTQFNVDNWPTIVSSRKGADIVTASPLNYTIVRGAWFDDRGDRNYTLSAEGEPFGGRTISRTSIADFMLQLADKPELYSRTSVGIHRPLGSE